MPLTEYLIQDAHGFTEPEQGVLRAWHAACDVDDAWRLMRRNLDRECDRQDIDHTVLAEYLREVAGRYAPDGADPEPLTVMGARFLLRGRLLADTKMSVSTVTRGDHLLKYQLREAGFPITIRLEEALAMIKAGAITGADLAGAHMGRRDYPVWVCKTDQLPITADDCRDRLGLQHVVHGHLVALSYSGDLLEGDTLAIRAPTFPDSVAHGENWIFAKRPGPGGPNWGHTVDLATSSAGVDEAVHRDFDLDTEKAARIAIRYIGQIQNSPPQVNFQKLLQQV